MKLHLLEYPNDILDRTSKPVTKFDPKLKMLAGAMHWSMLKWGGVGLAAPQVGRNIGLIVIDTMHVPDIGVKRSIVNPVITHLPPVELWQDKLEMCLSFPGRKDGVKRPKACTIKYQDLVGREVEESFAGLSAQAILHEIQHLHGITLDNPDINVVYSLVGVSLENAGANANNHSNVRTAAEG